MTDTFGPVNGTDPPSTVGADPIARLRAALKGRYNIEREIG